MVTATVKPYWPRTVEFEYTLCSHSHLSAGPDPQQAGADATLQ